MSRDYWTEGTLLVTPSFETIHTILKKGVDIGLTYDNRLQEERAPDKSWDIQEAAKWLTAIFSNRREGISTHERSYLVFVYRGDSSALSFSEDNALLNIAICPAGDVWWKSDPSDRLLDFARYMRLLLQLCEDFPFFELKTFDYDIEEEISR